MPPDLTPMDNLYRIGSHLLIIIFLKNYTGLYWFILVYTGLLVLKRDDDKEVGIW